MFETLDWVAKRAQLSKNKTAIISATDRKSWSYQDINKRAIQLSNYLLLKGIRKGDRVAFIAPNSIYYFDFLFACGKIGAIFVPLNWRLAPSEIEVILTDCQPKIVGIHHDLRKHFRTITENNRILLIEEAFERKLVNQKDCLQTVPNLAAEDPLAIFYTGGTTGKPKGVVLSFASIQWNAINTIISWGLHMDDVTYTCMPMFHTGGLNALTLPILMSGGTVVIAQQFEAEQVIQDINKFGITIILMVPTMYDALVSSATFMKVDFPTVQTFLSGGAPCPITIYQHFAEKGLPFKEGYGLTEAGPNNFFIKPSNAKKKQGSVGKPMLLNEVKIINKEGKGVGVNEVGELLIRGKHLFVCYWNNKAETEHVLRDQWLHTGDLAKFDVDGDYYIVGRKKDIIITGGENVYPQEIEHVLFTHPKITEVTVVGIPHKIWGEMVIAFIVRQKGKEISEIEVQNYCRKKMARFKVPKRIYFIDEIPKTEVGKIDKKTLLRKAMTRNHI